MQSGVKQPDLRGVRTRWFLLTVALSTLFITVFLSRPVQAENLISGLSCLVQGDCEAPATPEPLAPDDDSYQASNTFVFRWGTVEDPSGVSYDICVSSSTSFIGATCLRDLSGTEQPASDLMPDEDALWYWRVRAEDGIGNASEWSPSRRVTIDTVDPQATLGSDVALIGGDSPIANLSGTISDDHLSHYDVTIFNADGDVVANTSDMNDGTSADVSYTWDVSTPDRLPSGTYRVVLTAGDKAGRAGQANVEIIVDNDGPDLTIRGGDVIIKGGSIRPVVEATDPQDVISYAWTADAANPSTVDFDPIDPMPVFAPTVEGSYRFTLDVIDGLGNVTTGTFEFGFQEVLDPLPLPTNVQPGVQEQSQAYVPMTISPVDTPSRTAKEEEAEQPTTSLVLGTSTSSTGDPVTPASVATVTSTEKGWSILGIVWYWWAVIIAAFLGAWAFIRRLVVRV